MAAVESSLPTSATVTSITIKENALSITGVVPRDDVLATFALRLRQTNVFSSVFVVSSATVGSTTLFSIKAVLPTPLSDTAEITDGSDPADQPADNGAGDQEGGGNNGGGNNNGDAIIADGGSESVASVDGAQDGEVEQ
jgi:hypothetical protein